MDAILPAFTTANSHQRLRNQSLCHVTPQRPAAVAHATLQWASGVRGHAEPITAAAGRQKKFIESTPASVHRVELL